MLQDCHGNIQGRLKKYTPSHSIWPVFPCMVRAFFHSVFFSIYTWGLFLSPIISLLLCMWSARKKLRKKTINRGYTELQKRLWSEFSALYESLLFNCGVGVGTVTFSGLYSSVLYLDFILFLPSTSSDCRVYLPVCLPSARMLSDEVEGWDAAPAPQARQRREQPVWENVCPQAFHGATYSRGGGLAENLSQEIWPESHMTCCFNIRILFYCSSLI